MTQNMLQYRLFVLSYKNFGHQTSYKQYFFSTIEMKDYNVIIDKKFFDQTLKNDLGIYDIIRKNATGQGDDCIPGCY